MRRALSLLLFTTTLLIFITPLKATFFNNSLASIGPDETGALTVVNLPTRLLPWEGHKCSIILGNQDPPFRIRTIVVDAGHGGHDRSLMQSRTMLIKPEKVGSRSFVLNWIITSTCKQSNSHLTCA